MIAALPPLGECGSCFKTSETEAGALRLPIIGWVPLPTLRRCANDDCHSVRSGEPWERFAHAHRIYSYKYFGDYELSPEQLDAVGEFVTLAAQGLRSVQTLDLIDELRAEEGHSVMIHCDNPDGPPNCAVEVCADWTDWEWRRFTGETVLAALQAAKDARP